MSSLCPVRNASRPPTTPPTSAQLCPVSFRGNPGGGRLPVRDTDRTLRPSSEGAASSVPEPPERWDMSPASGDTLPWSTCESRVLDTRGPVSSPPGSVTDEEFTSWMCLFTFRKAVTVTLVNNIVEVLKVRFGDASSAHGVACSPREVTWPDALPRPGALE